MRALPILFCSVMLLALAGVYGDYGGEWVDETSPLRVTPSAGKPFLRAQAEAAWLQLHAAHGVPVHVFRLGGIYGAWAHAARIRAASQLACMLTSCRICLPGPGRSLLEARRASGRSGGARSSDSQRARAEKRYISRCHVADIVTAVDASMAAPRPGCAPEQRTAKC
jgi:nucleoside-diphosphate-sugar epimerase